MRMGTCFGLLLPGRIMVNRGCLLPCPENTVYCMSPKVTVSRQSLFGSEYLVLHHLAKYLLMVLSTFMKLSRFFVLSNHSLYLFITDLSSSSSLVFMFTLYNAIIHS